MKPNCQLLVFSGAGCPQLPVAAGLPLPSTLAPPTEMPDGRVCLTDSGGQLVAHVALWWRETPWLEGARIGALGGFAATDLAAARAVLDEAAAQLRSQGCRLAVGPLNGNTWRTHRWVIESDGRGPFLLEPRNPAEYPIWWRQAGFNELSRYSSSLVELSEASAMAPEVGARLTRTGVVIRGLDRAAYDDDLRRVHELSLKSFANNFLYTPLPVEAFVAAYLPLRDHVDPALVRIAERDGATCGFVFAVADLEAKRRGEEPALIVKTLAVDPEARCAGLGTLLVDEVQRNGLAMGYRQAIHALQYQTNTSLKITGRYGGRIFRRYALFSRPL